MEQTHEIVPVQQFSTPIASIPENFSNSVFLAEDVFLSIFFPTQPAPSANRRYSSGAPCQGSSMNA